MIESYDVGSLPFSGDFEKFLEGAKSKLGSESWLYFERKVVNGLLMKLKAGIDVPNFPQFRDMMEMFLEVLDGIQKSKRGYVVVEPLGVKRDRLIIPEVEAIKRKASELYEELNEPVRIKLCITGPYTLSLVFSPEVDRTWLIEQLGHVFAKLAGENVFRSDKIGVEIISMDEPVLGLVDDPLLDYGSRTREVLLRAWEKIFSVCRSKGTKTCIHLHSTSNKIFWDITSLDIVESHVGDQIYSSPMVKSLLEEKDMFLKASIARTDFDALIKRYLIRFHKNETAIGEKMGEIWKRIRKSEIDPVQFLEDVDLLFKRLSKAIDLFGYERVKYAGPECGLGSFPSYECAIECLRRVSTVVRKMNRSLNLK